MKKDIKFLIARNCMRYGRKEADWNTDGRARFVNEYLRDQRYTKVDIDYVEDYPTGAADEQPALRDEIGSAYRPKRSSNPIGKYAR